ncbi:MAG: hypothetical protein L3K19_02460 [Thermoplasmata archaeon]|nr:hypothetical protein [Thermoplasmata archaeon]
MNPPTSTGIVRSLHELLELDPSLSSTDAKVLEVLMLEPRPFSAREISRSTRTNLQGLYSSLERLVARGLVARADGSPAMTFLAANPKVVLHELLGPFRRARELVEELEGPLRILYGSPGRSARPHVSSGPTSTGSSAAATSWLLDRLAIGRQEVWFLGSETPWFGPSLAVESELAIDPPDGRRGAVRLLVRSPPKDDPRRLQHGRLRREGVEVRYSPRFSTPAVIIDRAWMLMRSGAISAGAGGNGAYVRLETPELCADLADAAEQEWQRSPDPTGREEVRRRPTPDRPSEGSPRRGPDPR